MGEWVETTLGEIADFRSGGTPSKSRADLWTGNVPWVSAKDMKRFRLDDTEDHVSEAAIGNGTRLVPAGAVFLLTRGMTLLRDVPICVAQQPMTFNQDVKALLPMAHVEPRYFPYLLLGNKHRFSSLVDLAGHGTGRLNTDEVKAVSLRLPPPAEQRAIAQILSTIDDRIDLNERMKGTLEALTRAIFKSWFVDFDPVRAKAEARTTGLRTEVACLFPDRMEQSRHGDVPYGWEVEPLSNIATFLNGLALQKHPSFDPADGLPVIKIRELRSGVSETTDMASREIPEAYIVRDGDFIFSWSGTLLAKFWTGGAGALNQHLFKVTSDRYPAWFFAGWIMEHLKEFRWIAASKATTMGHIQRHHLQSAMTVCPPDETIAALSAIIDPLVQRGMHVDSESRSLRTLRHELLAKLVSGEISVANAELVVEAV